MEKIKSINFINDCYGDRTMDVLKNDNGLIEFHEMCNEQSEDEKIPSKVVNWITVKWCAENGRLEPKDINEFVGEIVTDANGEHEITKVKKNKGEKTIIKVPKAKKTNVDNSYEGLTMLYKGKSKKIKTEIVVVISDNGSKCKIKDEDGNEALVAKTTLKKI
jgi:hypothetical protein